MSIKFPELLFLITLTCPGTAFGHRNHDADGICLRDGTVLTLKPENQVQRKAACLQAKGQWMIPEHTHGDEHLHEHSHCHKGELVLEMPGKDDTEKTKACQQAGGEWVTHDHKHSHEEGHGHQSHGHGRCLKEGKTSAGSGSAVQQKQICVRNGGTWDINIQTQEK